MIVEKILRFPLRLYNFIELKRKHIEYGNNLNIKGKIYFHGHGKVRIGNDVTIKSSHKSNATAGGYASHFSIGADGVLVIGSHVGISNVALTAEEKVVIGDNVLIGSNCMITDTDFHAINTENRILDDGTGVKKSPVFIKNNAFIGARCIILKGVTIGENCIVGAGSVVTRNIPDNEIWAGNPAVFIKQVESRMKEGGKDS